MNYIEHDSFGRIVAKISVGFPVELGVNQIEVNPSAVFDAHSHYVQNGELVPFPEKPSTYHDWDWPTKSWLPNLDAAKTAKKAEIETERNRRLYLPVAFAAGRFDADPVSRDRITGMIGRLQRGDGLPAGWLGWRDADNAMHWQVPDPAAVLEQLSGLARAIEDREQAVLVASWNHKANIASLTDIDTILSYDVTASWPV